MWYKKRSYSRTHYEDMWSPYEECRQIKKDELMKCGSQSGRILLKS